MIAKESCSTMSAHYSNGKRIIIEDQGPRDGFQSQSHILSTAEKLSLIHNLALAGVSRIQVCSFVHPRIVPQMADAQELCSQLRRQNGVVYSGLTLNQKGVERAIDAGLNHIAASISVSDAHSRRNTRMSLAEARVGFGRMLASARLAGLTVRGGLQCVFGCRPGRD